MVTYKAILTIAVVCTAIGIISADSITKLEAQVEDAVKADRNKDPVEVAIKTLNSGGLKSLLFSKTLNHLQKSLEIVQNVKKWDYERILCDSQYEYETIEKLGDLVEKLTLGGPLRQAVQKTIDLIHKRCAQDLLKNIKSRISVNIDILIEEVAKVKNVCKDVDQTQPLWQFECVKHIKQFDAKRFAQATLNYIRRFESDQVLEDINKNTDREADWQTLERLQVRYLDAKCRNLRDGLLYKYEEDLAIRMMELLNRISSNHLSGEDSQMLKRATGETHLCVILPSDWKSMEELAQLMENNIRY